MGLIAVVAIGLKLVPNQYQLAAAANNQLVVCSYRCQHFTSLSSSNLRSHPLIAGCKNRPSVIATVASSFAAATSYANLINCCLAGSILTAFTNEATFDTSSLANPNSLGKLTAAAAAVKHLTSQSLNPWLDPASIANFSARRF